MTQPIEFDDEAATEQYDEIPWSHLVEDLGRPGPSTPLIAGVALVVGIALGFVGAVVFGGGDTSAADDAPPAIVAPTGAPPAAPPETPVTTTDTPVSIAAAEPSPEVLFSEADLMAVADDHESRAAAVRAEWFVRDFFTVDGSGPIGAAPADVLEGIAPVHGPEVVTYVEWARAIIVEPTAPGEYDVAVAFQLLAADGDVFVRHPARSVRVPIIVGPDLETAAIGLPRPAPLETMHHAPPVVADQPAPQTILDEAVAAALRFGTDATIVGSSYQDGTWHIVTSVRFAGSAWPLQIDVAQPEGAP